MLRKLIIAATLLAIHAAVAAQTPGGAPLNTAKEFAQMKLNKEYLSEESTTQDPRQALENADLLLINRINEYLAANHPGTPLSPAVLAGIKHLRMLRGDHTRVLSYISIAEITGGAPPAAPATPAPPSPAPPVREAEAERPTQEAPAPAQPVGLSEHQRAPQVKPSSPLPAPEASPLPLWQLEVIQELLKAKDITEASSLLGFFSQIKKVKAFGLVTDCPDRAAAYWVIGDPAAGVKALLSPEDPSGARRDFRSGTSATLSSFSGSPAIWFTF